MQAEIRLISNSYYGFFKLRLCAEAKLRMATRRAELSSGISQELMTECSARIYAANKGLHSDE